MYMVVPLVGIEGACTQMLADELAEFQFSIQKGISVLPSLAVKRTSAPLLWAFAKLKELSSRTRTWKLVSAVPLEFETVTGLRYDHALLNGTMVRVAVFVTPR